MRRLLLSTVAATALVGGTALAADLPVRTLAPAPAPVAYAPAFTWAGVYAGVNIGAGRRQGDGTLNWGRDAGLLTELGGDARFIELDDEASGRFGSRDNWRLTGGAQVGVQGQWGNLVAGLEADFNWLGGGARSGTASRRIALVGEGDFEGCDGRGNFAICGTEEVTVRGDAPRWVSTLRGRLGFAFDRFLVYGTGGVAFQPRSRTTTQSRIEFDCPEGEECDEGELAALNGEGDVRHSNRNQVGWAAGFGIEWAFLNNMSLGLEYLRADFGSYDVTYEQPVGASPLLALYQAGGQETVRVDDKIDMVRLKLNARF